MPREAESPRHPFCLAHLYSAAGISVSPPSLATWILYQSAYTGDGDFAHGEVGVNTATEVYARTRQGLFVSRFGTMFLGSNFWALRTAYASARFSFARCQICLRADPLYGTAKTLTAAPASHQILLVRRYPGSNSRSRPAGQPVSRTQTQRSDHRPLLQEL